MSPAEEAQAPGAFRELAGERLQDLVQGEDGSWFPLVTVNARRKKE